MELKARVNAMIEWDEIRQVGVILQGGDKEQCGSTWTAKNTLKLAYDELASAAKI